MASFSYQDKDGKNEANTEASIYVDKSKGIVSVGVYEGDMDGASYAIYAPNHRASLKQLAEDILSMLEATKDFPPGFDGFSFPQAGAVATGEQFFDDDEVGVVNWY